MSSVVAALGPEVTGTKVGDEVYGLIPFVRDGAAAEDVTVPTDVLAAKPATVHHDAAAAVPWRRSRPGRRWWTTLLCGPGSTS